MSCLWAQSGCGRDLGSSTLPVLCGPLPVLMNQTGPEVIFNPPKEDHMLSSVLISTLSFPLLPRQGGLHRTMNREQSLLCAGLQFGAEHGLSATQHWPGFNGTGNCGMMLEPVLF